MAAPILSGTTLHPSKVTPEDTFIGTLHEAADGTQTWQAREGATQRTVWTLTWEKVSATTALAVRALLRAAPPYTFVDPFGVSYSVTRGDDSFHMESSAILTNTTEAWDVTIKLYEVVS